MWLLNLQGVVNCILQIWHLFWCHCDVCGLYFSCVSDLWPCSAVSDSLSCLQTSQLNCRLLEVWFKSLSTGWGGQKRASALSSRFTRSWRKVSCSLLLSVLSVDIFFLCVDVTWRFNIDLKLALKSHLLHLMVKEGWFHMGFFFFFFKDY